MLPFLIDTTIAGFRFRLPAYGVFLALAFSAAYFESLRGAIRTGEKTKHIENLFLFVIISSIVGSRLFHVFFEEPEYYFSHPEKIIAVWEGGYTLYGAMLASIFSVWAYTKYSKLRPLSFIDIASPGTTLGISIGRFGCFLAGCCWGQPTTCPLGVTFDHPQTFAGLKAIPVHPTQLYESFGAFLLFLYLVWRFRHRKYVGQITFHALSLYALLRFNIEFFRGDEGRGFLFGGLLSYSQTISLGILTASVIGLLYLKKEAKKPS